MSLTLSTAAAASSVAPWRGVAWLVEMDFLAGTQRYTNTPINLTVGGYTYAGYSGLVDVSTVKETEVSSTEKVTFSFSVVNQAMLAATIGNVDGYRGRKVRLYLQFMDQNWRLSGDPVPRWFGYMDRVKVSRQRPSAEGGDSFGRIEMECSRAGMARARNYEGLRLTHAQHVSRHPGDNGLEYIQRLIEQPTKWLSRRFQVK